MAFARAMEWNEGEHKMHLLTKVGEHDNPTTPFLTPRAESMANRYPLMSLGTLDDMERPWCTLWGSGLDDQENFPIAQQVGPSVLGIRGRVDTRFDPVVSVLYGERDDGEVLRSEGPGKMVSGLSLFLEERGRVKLYGRMVAGALQGFEEQRENGGSTNGEKTKTGQAQLVLKIEQSLGNCPKYLNSKKIVSVPKEEFRPRLVSKSKHLCPEAVELINHKADMFFVSSSNADQDMDSNHRGGPKGFVRIEENDEAAAQEPEIITDGLPGVDNAKGAVIVWPEYSGNNLYQTLGNLLTTPRAGLCIPDFETGDVLYLTGCTEILIGNDAHAVIPKSKLAVRLHISEARFVESGLPFRGVGTRSLDRMGTETGASPYNPKVWYLKSEKSEPLPGGDADGSEVGAVMIQSTKLSPTINRYRFALEKNEAFPPWKPGQYVALSFTHELDMGYSHMRDDDPVSLNDDYLRTFTVSSRFPLGDHGEEFEITVRNVGSITGWLARQRVDRGIRVDVGVMGFGGDFVIKQNSGTKLTPFIAGGIGITPVLGQLEDLDLSKFRLFWTTGVRDVGLVLDSFETYPGLAGITELFMTGDPEQLSDDEKNNVEEVRQQTHRFETRRLRKEDLELVLDEVQDDWYLCTTPTLRNQIQGWLPGKNVVFENFDY